MSRTLKTDIPGIDWRVHPEDAGEQGWRAIFSTTFPKREPELVPLVVEIGFGRGEFLMDLAAKHPELAFVGVEKSWRRVLKMARRLARTDLQNIRIVEASGERVVSDLPPGSVSEFWVNFPDPWPKKRHCKHRFLQPAMIRELALRLTEGGVLHVATDHADYASFIDSGLKGEPLLENLLAPAPFSREVPGRIRTAYEEIWRAQGSVPHFFEYERCAGAHPDGGRE